MQHPIVECRLALQEVSVGLSDQDLALTLCTVCTKLG
jgi:hypothetical protein